MRVGSGKGRVGFEPHAHLIERQGMAERDRLGGALGRGEAGGLGEREGVAFGQRARLEPRERPPAHAQAPARDGAALGGGLAADVHHPRLGLHQPPIVAKRRASPKRPSGR